MSQVKEFNLFEMDEETGEVQPVRSVRLIKGSQLGRGWFVMYDKAIDILLERNASPTVWKVYFKLLRLHGYDSSLRVQKEWLIKELGVDRNAFYKALTWLKDNNFISETESMGQTAFVLNPNFSARGTKPLKQRKALWSFSVSDPSYSAV